MKLLLGIIIALLCVVFQAHRVISQSNVCSTSPLVFPNSTVSTACTADTDCVLVNCTAGYQCCPSCNSSANIAADEWVGVNGSSYSALASCTQYCGCYGNTLWEPKCATDGNGFFCLKTPTAANVIGNTSCQEDDDCALIQTDGCCLTIGSCNPNFRNSNFLAINTDTYGLYSEGCNDDCQGGGGIICIGSDSINIWTAICVQGVCQKSSGALTYVNILVLLILSINSL